MNAFSLWPPDAVTITRGAERLAAYHETERSIRKWCTACGGHVLTEHPGFGLIDVYAGASGSLSCRVRRRLRAPPAARGARE